MLPFTRAVVGPFCARASSAGCQHLRFTSGWFWLTTPLDLALRERPPRPRRPRRAAPSRRAPARCS